MTTFKEANQIRVRLKMQLSDYSWYSSCSILTSNDSDYYIAVFVKNSNSKIKDIVPNIVPDNVKDLPIKVIFE